MATMKVGERAVFTISSDYGYGDEGYEPVIPGGAKLMFDVEMCVIIAVDAVRRNSPRRSPDANPLSHSRTLSQAQVLQVSERVSSVLFDVMDLVCVCGPAAAAANAVAPGVERG